MSDLKFDVSGMTALVTGASSGLGAHFAAVLADHGANVIAAARRREKLNALVDAIRATNGSAIAVDLDVTSEQSVRDCFDAAEDAFGIVNILSNNAGVADPKPAIDIDRTSWDYVVETNLNGTWLTALEAGRRLIKAGLPGSIVNTASVLGLRVANGQSSYSASKAAVVQLSKSLALEWARYNIRVNALCPGYFETEMNKDFFASQEGKDFILRSPARRTGELWELSAPFMLLASDAGSFMTGVALPVDGGHSIGNV